MADASRPNVARCSVLRTRLASVRLLARIVPNRGRLSGSEDDVVGGAMASGRSTCELRTRRSGRVAPRPREDGPLLAVHRRVRSARAARYAPTVRIDVRHDV